MRKMERLIVEARVKDSRANPLLSLSR